jgi:cysteine desulfurase
VSDPAAPAGRVYLDHASSSPLRPAALAAMLPFLRDHHADPGRVHSDGRITRVAIEAAREQVAALVGARPREIVFTSGGTESVNTAVFGAVRHADATDVRPRVVTSAVEHSSVHDACAREAVEMVTIAVDAFGRVAADDVAAAITPATAFVSIQLANHEVGTVQPAAAIIAAARAHGVLVHVDACAAVGVTPVDFAGLDADLMSLCAHPWGGPKGIGALAVRRGLRLAPFVVGGMQERARRGGLENVPAIVGFGAAAHAVTESLATEVGAARAHTGRLRAEIPRLVDGVTFYGDPTGSVPNLVCFGVAGVEAEPILLALDQHGIAVHSGSACSSESLEPSPVLAAMGADADHALRVSVGWSTTDDDISRFLGVFPGIIDQFRRLRPS